MKEIFLAVILPSFLICLLVTDETQVFGFCFPLRHWENNHNVNFECVCFQGHGVLEMPSGTGKTISLLSLIIAYQKVSLSVCSYDFLLRLSVCFQLWSTVASHQKMPHEHV